MKRLIVPILLILTLLTACSGGGSPTPLPTVALGTSSPNGSSAQGVTASGEVVPAQKVQLSLPLTGVVKTVEVKEGDRVTAGQTLVTLDTTILEAQVKQAEANLAATQTQLKYLIRIGTDQEHLTSAQADIDRAQATLDAANATLAQATLTAPFDGTIASVDISPAETVVPGQIVITLADLSHFQVETTDLSERDIPSVKLGQAAELFVQALNQTFPGKVTDIARVSSTVGGDVVYKVTIEFDTQPQDLYWGMSVDVTIPTEN